MRDNELARSISALRNAIMTIAGDAGLDHLPCLGVPTGSFFERELAECLELGASLVLELSRLDSSASLLGTAKLVVNRIPGFLPGYELSGSILLVELEARLCQWVSLVEPSTGELQLRYRRLVPWRHPLCVDAEVPRTVLKGNRHEMLAYNTEVAQQWLEEQFGRWLVYEARHRPQRTYGDQRVLRDLARMLAETERILLEATADFVLDGGFCGISALKEFEPLRDSVRRYVEWYWLLGSRCLGLRPEIDRRVYVWLQPEAVVWDWLEEIARSVEINSGTSACYGVRSLMTQRAYALSRRRSHTAVRKAILAERIELIDGLIDPDAADEALGWKPNATRVQTMEPNVVRTVVGSQIRFLKNKRRLTWEKLAEEMNLSDARWLQAVACGAGKPSDGMRFTIAEYSGRCGYPVDL